MQLCVKQAIRLILLNKIFELLSYSLITCQQAPSKVGKKFGERASGSQRVVTPRAKRAGRGGACRHYGPYDPTTATATWDFFTSGCVLRMSRFLRRRCPFPRGRREVLFDVVRKRGINQTEAWQRNQGKNETLGLNLKKISLYDMSETNRAWSLLYTTTN